MKNNVLNYINEIDSKKYFNSIILDKKSKIKITRTEITVNLLINLMSKLMNKDRRKKNTIISLYYENLSQATIPFERIKFYLFHLLKDNNRLRNYKLDEKIFFEIQKLTNYYLQQNESNNHIINLTDLENIGISNTKKGDLEQFLNKLLILFKKIDYEFYIYLKKFIKSDNFIIGKGFANYSFCINFPFTLKSIIYIDKEENNLDYFNIIHEIGHLYHFFYYNSLKFEFDEYQSEIIAFFFEIKITMIIFENDFEMKKNFLFRYILNLSFRSLFMEISGKIVTCKDYTKIDVIFYNLFKEKYKNIIRNINYGEIVLLLFKNEDIVSFPDSFRMYIYSQLKALQLSSLSISEFINIIKKANNEKLNHIIFEKNLTTEDVDFALGNLNKLFSML